ncbi:MAG TPA: hypothetical protein VMY37_10970 [Thermoguttaceae bacterium]|nr:hypothetical protein [Thermoguttaceae bacterium]
MRDDWLLINLGEGILAASLGFPVAAILGYDPRAGFLVGLALAFVPSILLSRFASDFTSDEDPVFNPNFAARLLNVHEYVRGVAFVAGLVAMLLSPIGALLGLRGRSLAIFLLVASPVLCGLIAALLALIARRAKRNGK